MRALHEAGGNKQQAADTLGIARSTLYRKVRALGLDLRVNAY
ncbi:helix-turn-helix domain-containing protein [Mycolicibacterium fortuitum]|nr:helix-turn-helix domain-containing protein [Mycolicibacterium fortuitum]WEV36056.1 helix-turn-helix domain-containing protein [Mycolicibacterium fortuitum]